MIQKGLTKWYLKRDQKSTKEIFNLKNSPFKSKARIRVVEDNGYYAEMTFKYTLFGVKTIEIDFGNLEGVDAEMSPKAIADEFWSECIYPMKRVSDTVISINNKKAFEDFVKGNKRLRKALKESMPIYIFEDTKNDIGEIFGNEFTDQEGRSVDAVDVITDRVLPAGNLYANSHMKKAKLLSIFGASFTVVGIIMFVISGGKDSALTVVAALLCVLSPLVFLYSFIKFRLMKWWRKG